MPTEFVAYLDVATDRRLFVAEGIGSVKTWATYYRKPSGALKRFVSPALPICRSKVIAQQMLDAWAASHNARRA